MNAKSLYGKKNEMMQTTESFRYLIKEKLIQIDNNARAMTSELAVMGVPKNMVDEYLPQWFATLWEEVKEEQCEKYDRGRRETA